MLIFKPISEKMVSKRIQKFLFVNACGVLLVSLASVLVGGCGTSRPRSNHYGSERAQSTESSAFDDGAGQSLEQVVQQARRSGAADGKAYSELDRVYHSPQGCDSVFAQSNQFFKLYPTSQYLDQVYYLRGLCALNRKQPQLAVAAFQSAIDKSFNPVLRSSARFNLALTYFEAFSNSHLTEAATVINQVRPSHLDDAGRYKLYVLGAKLNRALGNFYDSVSAGHKAYDEAVKSEKFTSQKNVLVDFLRETFQKVDGENNIRRLLEQFPSSPIYGEMANALRKYERVSAANPYKIGVLMSLSGKFSRLTSRALKGVFLAFDAFKRIDDNTQTSEVNSFSLHIVDDGGEEGSAVKALESLYYQHGVVAVIGPVASKPADAVAKRAQELGLPLMLLTQKEVLAGDYVFNSPITPRNQMRALVRYAVKQAEVCDFAVLAPQGKYGEQFVRAFFGEVERRSCKVRGYETYPEAETDFRVYIDRMVGLSNLQVRAKELEEIRKAKAIAMAQSANKKLTKKQEAQFRLKPIVDFKAVFVPDEPKLLGQVIPTFAYRDVDNVLFLGNNSWNSNELLSRAAGYVENAVFVDGFFAASSAPSVKEFIARYREQYSEEPGSIEAYAYDAGRVLRDVLQRGSHSRDEVRTGIQHLQKFPGVGGEIHFEDGHLTKELNLLTVKNGRIVELGN